MAMVVLMLILAWRSSILSWAKVVGAQSPHSISLLDFLVYFTLRVFLQYFLWYNVRKNNSPNKGKGQNPRTHGSERWGWLLNTPSGIPSTARDG